MPNFQIPSKVSNSKKIILKNARIIDPRTRYDKIGDLLIEGDKIADFGENIVGSSNPSDSIIYNCDQNLLSPGLIDIQVHFREPGQTHKEDLTSGSMSAVAGGITSVVCQPNTSPVIDNEEIVKDLYERAKEKAYCNIYTYGAITKSMKGEELTDMKSLKDAGVVGYTDDGLPVMNAYLMRRAFEEAKKFDLRVAQHAEDLNLTNKGCINEGEISRKLNVKGIPNISESTIVARDIEILALTKSKYHLLHVSTKEALDIIKQAKDRGLDATVEVSPHHLFLNDSAVLENMTNAKMNPPLRSEEDRLYLIEALKAGVIDAIATDHAPHDFDSKNKPLESASFGIVGVETMLPLSLSLYHNKEMNLIDIFAKMTCNAADIIGVDTGRIKKGVKADLVLIDLDYAWQIDVNKFYSKSKNSPFNQKKVKGKVIKTIVSGKIVFES